MKCGPEMAILWLGPFISHVTPDVDQTPCTVHLTPRPQATVPHALWPRWISVRWSQLTLCTNLEKLLHANSDLSHLAPIRGHLHFAGRCAGRRSPESTLVCGAQARARARGAPGILPCGGAPEPPGWRNGPGMRPGGSRK